MTKTVLITGASSGIGAAAASVFAKNGWNLVLAGRRKARLVEVAATLSAYKVAIQTCVLDVRNAHEVENILGPLPCPDLLINNAGLARGLAPIDQGLLSDWDEMIDTNLKGLLYVSRVIAAKMRTQGAGHIILVGSTAAKEMYPNGNVYSATKHAVDALAKGMRMDLIQAGVKVSCIHPGFVETEFSLVRFHGDTERAKKVYDGFRPLSGEDVAETLYWIASAPAHVNLADVVVVPAAQASAMVVNRKL
jgi:3-hydroxy acid dehydrogenase/malonic semialdehyde reductase